MSSPILYGTALCPLLRFPTGGRTKIRVIMDTDLDLATGVDDIRFAVRAKNGARRAPLIFTQSGTASAWTNTSPNTVTLSLAPDAADETDDSTLTLADLHATEKAAWRMDFLDADSLPLARLQGDMEWLPEEGDWTDEPASTTTLPSLTVNLVNGAVTVTVSLISEGSGTVDNASVNAAISEDAAATRTALGLGTAATTASTAYEAAGAVTTHAAVTSGVHGISSFGASLIDDADATAARTTLGLGTAATTATTAYEAAGAVTTHAAVTSGVHGISSFGASLIDDADASAARTTLGLGTAATTASTAYEAAGAVTTHAAVTSGVHGISSFGASLIDDADASSARTTLGLGTIATQAANSVAITGGSVTGLSALTASSGALTASTPYSLAQTWNNSGVTFTGLLFNATNTASGSASLFADFQLGGVSTIALRRSGEITATQYQAGGSSGLAYITGVSTGFGWMLGFTGGGVPGGGEALGVFNNGVVSRSDRYIGWASGTSIQGNSRDLFLFRGAAATLQLGETHATTPTAQTLRAHGVTTGTGASLTLQGGSGSVARGNVILDGGNRSAYIASPTTTQIRDILISHGLMAAS